MNMFNMSIVDVIKTVYLHLRVFSEVRDCTTTRFCIQNDVKMPNSSAHLHHFMFPNASARFACSSSATSPWQHVPMRIFQRHRLSCDQAVPLPRHIAPFGLTFSLPIPQGSNLGAGPGWQQAFLS